MNCKLVVAKAIEKYNTQRTSYFSYFKSQAKIENRNNYIEFSDFFDGCKYIISLYKKEIEGQLRKEINEDISDHNNCRRMLVIGKSIESEVDLEYELLRQKKDNIISFLSDKYADNSQYKCCIRSDNGEIVENNFTGHLIPYNDDHTSLKYCIFDLTYLDVLRIEKELINAENDFINNKIFSFRTFLKCNEVLKDEIILFIRNEIDISTKINITVATITYALQIKKYLSFDNQTLYHKAFKEEFGKAGQRYKFSERYGECNTQHQNIIQHYVNNLP